MKQYSTKNKKVQTQMDRLNTAIHRFNLYAHVDGMKRRVIEAHIFDGKLCVTDLHTGKSIPVDGVKLEDSYGVIYEIPCERTV